MENFVHLHVHSQYSLLDGAVRIKELMKKAKGFEMPAVALTDHGNLYGAVEFYQAARSAGIKPILGCEAYMAPGSMKDRKASSGKDAAYHFTLLAQNEVGWRNLVKLITAAHLEGFYYKPRIDKEILAAHSEGLIGLSGCLKGEVNSLISVGQLAQARDVAAQYRDIFGKENFFIELHDHGLDAQRKCTPELIKIAKELDLGLVAANDVHFLEREHHEAHDVMICIGTGSMIHDEKRLHYVPELYFKSPEEMRKLFAETPEACDNTLRIAERCNFEMEFGKLKYPSYEVPETTTREQYLRDLCQQGLEKRFTPEEAAAPEIQERLAKELGVLENAGFVSYFLIVWDFIDYAKRNGIPVGPGRGSAAGSLIAYLLGITDLNPLRYGLIFERFLNPERVSPPDIDIDFCINRRVEVIDYVRRKYGERSVSQIVTFGTLGAKSVIRDVGRVMGLSYGEVDRIAKMIPNELNITLNSRTDKDGKSVPGAIDKNPDLKRAVEEEPATRQLWEYASVLEGLSRNSGIHAAGVVIGAGDLSDEIPLSRGKENEIVTQFDMGGLTELGMLKMDFLGLKNLTIIQDAVNLIQKKEPDFKIETIPLDDTDTFAVYNRGETIGVFQVESGGMTKTCRKFNVQKIEDIIALIALYRPGPMEWIDDYIERKEGRKKVKYEHPLLEEVASETYGVLIYQEQVMKAASVMAGYSLGQSDLLRRAMGKKDEAKMAKERGRFIEGCATHHQIKENVASAVFDVLEKFAGYGFNKSHSATYALVSYQTAYLKAKYPLEFMAALLSNEYANTEKISILVSECKRMGIPILAPDVNYSALRFEPEINKETPCIRFGLSAIKNIGEMAMEAAIQEREKNGKYLALDDFCSRLDSRIVNRKTLESLVKCGAFDSVTPSRADGFASIEHALNAASATQRDRASGQVSMFDDMSIGIPEARKVAVDPWTQQETLANEKELLGFYVTGHPLDDYAGTIESSKFTTIAEVKELKTKKSGVKLAGILLTVEKRFTKTEGKPFAIFQLEDYTGSIELTAWSEVLAKYTEHLVPGKAVAITATVFPSDDSIRVSTSEIAPLKARMSRKPVLLRLDKSLMKEESLQQLVTSVGRYPGTRPLFLEFVNGEGSGFRFETNESFRVGDERALRKELGSYLIP
ncbi:MAG: DNA polymerase III subunit alpha [Chthoniobacterales bacterium]